MALRTNPTLVEELRRYGAEDVWRCFHCGNCTAACRLSEEPFAIPRRSMRAVQMGLDGRLRESLDPWLCYYCGDCSEQCPRGADPGETMMSMRRWLTAQYDVTGLAGLFYRSPRAQLAAMAAVALVTGAGLLAYGFLHGGGSLSVYDGPRAFLPEPAVHALDWAMGGALLALLLVNCARMWRFTMQAGGGPRPRARHYLREALLLPLHFLTQKRWRGCGRRGPWAAHLVLVASYVTMLVLIVLFLPAMQHGPEVRWQVHAFGYAAAAGLVAACTHALVSRARRSAPHHRRSHPSDWVFVGMLLAVTVTGIVQHALHRAGLPAAANLAYVVHLMAVAPFEICQVPFGKWSHMAYRPLAIWFAAVRRAAERAAAAEKSPVPLRAA
jgi:ferredoxin